jgi:uncharacterized repeat protein (TIGR03803 family)
LWFGFNGTDGSGPAGTLILDAYGNFYGTTASGGAYDFGTVFEITPGADGAWTETVLHNFNNNGSDGYGPLFESLIFDSAGNLYGTTFAGGAYDLGTVFRLTPGAGGTWTETVLYSFSNNGMDGCNPAAGVILRNGRLYGTTSSASCGGNSQGTVFELAPAKNGAWTETVLHSFNDGGDGYDPTGSLIFVSGKLYGTTQGGGAYDGGTVFQLAPGKNGTWKETILYSFNGSSGDGWQPWGGVIFRNDQFYGTTLGNVFELAKRKGKWTETNLHVFPAYSGDGTTLYDSPAFDAAGNLYGTTAFGGTYDGGTVFELIQAAGGTWTETLLYNFTTNSYPSGSLIFDAAGYLYGTTDGGGGYGDGTVFGFMP